MLQGFDFALRSSNRSSTILRDHVRDPGMGVACERVFPFFHAPVAESFKKSIASGEITWRCWYDGPLAGPITTRWGVWAPPTIFVLDKAGVIRFKDVRGADLDRAVATLLDEEHVEEPAPR